jgi:hypothetical protein
VFAGGIERVWGGGIVSVGVEYLPPPGGGGTDEVVVQVRDVGRSSIRPGQALFAPLVGGRVAVLMKLLSRSEVLTVPEGVRVVRTSRRRLGKLLKRSGAKVAPLAVAAASVRIKSCPASGWSRYWGGSHDCKQPPGAGCAVSVSLASPGIWTCV